ncbi:MAG: hypothetical protein JO212_12040 [Acetobacteraceae bacterium]|nr:hypothetical protein [Acetobacteraceae bacterium]
MCIVWNPGDGLQGQSLYIPHAPKEAHRPFYIGIRYDVDPETHRLTITELAGQDGSLRAANIIVPLFDTPAVYWPCTPHLKRPPPGQAASGHQSTARPQMAQEHSATRNRP